MSCSRVYLKCEKWTQTSLWFSYNSNIMSDIKNSCTNNIWAMGIFRFDSFSVSVLALALALAQCTWYNGGRSCSNLWNTKNTKGKKKKHETIGSKWCCVSIQFYRWVGVLGAYKCVWYRQNQNNSLGDATIEKVNERVWE